MSTEVRVYHKIDQAGNPETRIGDRKFSYPNIDRLMDGIDAAVEWLPENKRYVLIQNPFGLRVTRDGGHRMDLGAYAHCMTHPETRRWARKFLAAVQERAWRERYRWFFYLGNVADWAVGGLEQKAIATQSVMPLLRYGMYEVGFDAASSYRHPAWSRVFLKWLVSNPHTDNIYVEALPKMEEAEDWKYANFCINSDWLENPQRTHNKPPKINLDFATANDRRIIVMMHKDVKQMRLDKRIVKVGAYLADDHSVACSLRWFQNHGVTYEEMMG